MKNLFSFLKIGYIGENDFYNSIHIILLLMVLIITPVILSGCDLFGENLFYGEERGKVEIETKIPEEFREDRVEQQSLLEDIVLSSLKFEITMEDFRNSQEISIDEEDESVSVVFEDLPPGIWEISGRAIDRDDYEVAAGQNEVEIAGGETSHVNLTLDISPGQVVLVINAPEDERINSGRASLQGVVDGVDNITEEFSISSEETKQIDIGDAISRIWPVEVKLFDKQGDEIRSGEEQIAVKPGREVTANIEFEDGNLQITTHWNLPPSKPENVEAIYEDESIKVDWDESDEVQGYLVFRSTEEAGAGVTASENLIAGSSFIDEFSYQPGKTYWYRVVAYKSNGLSSNFSEPVSVIAGEKEKETETELTGNISLQHNFPFAGVDDFTPLNIYQYGRGRGLQTSASFFNSDEQVNSEFSQEIVVGYSPRLNREEAVNYLADRGYKVLELLPRVKAALVEMPEVSSAEAVSDIQSLSSVRYAEANNRYRALNINPPDDEFYQYQWHYPQIRLPQAWKINTGASNVNIAVLDTGVNTNHEDIGSNVDSSSGYNFIDDNSDYIDYHGHGTHVAGTIAADSNNKQGVAGVMWDANIIPVKVLDDDGFGGLWEISRGILYASGLLEDISPDQPADIINLSLGSGTYNELLQDTVEEAAAEGVIMVGAAGNSGEENLLYPAGFPQVISVGAVDFNHPDQPELAFYSNYDKELDLLAPGGDLEVNSNQGDYNDGVVSTGLDNEGDFAYMLFQGTSMAAPHVSGVLGLMLSEGISGDRAREILRNTAIEMDKIDYGAGLINAYWAVNQVSHVKIAVGQGAAEEFESIVEKQIPLGNDTFIMEELPEGEYTVRAWIDIRSNGELEPGDYFKEKQEVELSADSSVELELILEEITEF